MKKDHKLFSIPNFIQNLVALLRDKTQTFTVLVDQFELSKNKPMFVITVYEMRIPTLLVNLDLSNIIFRIILIMILNFIKLDK